MSKSDKEVYYTKKQLRYRFGIDKTIIAKYFPKPIEIQLSGKKPKKVWPSSVIEQIATDKSFAAAYEESLINSVNGMHSVEIRKQLRNASTIEYLLSDTYKGRHYILHVGPTNSGKTYNALESLKSANVGIYLGPLRLLALEVFDTLNKDSPKCSLLTGQEREIIPHSTIVSSTIEMCDYKKHYDVAVIDECQLISDEHRGANWTKAILQLHADDIHLCFAPEAYSLIIDMLEAINASYEVHKYERLTPLLYSGVCNSLSDVKPGDALISFSRKKVLAIAAELEENGVQTSVLYGALPPLARREEVRRFVTGESSVVVATDAIGMGVSLPIKRVVFCETEKHDGIRVRELSATEIKQIAGRAGRYRKYESGEVLTMSNPALIESSLSCNIDQLVRISIPFPRELIGEESDLCTYLDVWEGLFPEAAIFREDMSNARFLLGSLREIRDSFSNFELLKLITCPFNIEDRRLVGYWLRCCDAIKDGAKLPAPYFDETDLNGCEVQYRAHEIRHRLAVAFEMEDDLTIERQLLCEKINRFLAGDKNIFIHRCKECGKRLPATDSNLYCNDCQLELLLNKKILALSEGKAQNTIGSLAHISRWETK